MFNDVYDVLPQHLRKQKGELEEVWKKYPMFYDDEIYAK
jgi:hypothetical protein